MYMFSTSPEYSHFGRKTVTWRFWDPFGGLGITALLHYLLKLEICVVGKSGSGMPRINAFWRYEMKCSHKRMNNLETTKMRSVNKNLQQFSWALRMPAPTLAAIHQWPCRRCSASAVHMKTKFTNFVVCCSYKMFIMATSLSNNYCK